MSVFPYISKTIWTQDGCVIFPKIRSNSLPQLLLSFSWISEKTQEQDANAMFPIKYKRYCHCNQGMGLTLESNHETSIPLVAYGWRWVIFLVSPILTIKQWKRGKKFSLSMLSMLQYISRTKQMNECKSIVSLSTSSRKVIILRSWHQLWYTQNKNLLALLCMNPSIILCVSLES